MEVGPWDVMLGQGQSLMMALEPVGKGWQVPCEDTGILQSLNLESGFSLDTKSVDALNLGFPTSRA